MSSAVLDVQKIPQLLVAKYHSNLFSWREENGAVIFQPAEESSSSERRKNAWEELKKFRGVLPENFDYKKELLEASESTLDFWDNEEDTVWDNV